ncbi:hypothetical protein TSAR_014822 [Trichomalopsis sarcophagae]|uniref:Uncharacterized protein n=1 Tax=Trichomalopsis sarcophagae TaxID=543379 RepID=A0A232ELF6_9HYME|nr:hypothetical protein TSAR_014822 [Trichomalopsis sarcophagae]
MRRLRMYYYFKLVNGDYFARHTNSDPYRDKAGVKSYDRIMLHQALSERCSLNSDQDKGAS